MFWIHGEDLPAGVGIGRFGAVHLGYLAFFAALTVCYVLRYRRLDAGRRQRADRVLGSLVFLCGLCEYGVTALLGRFGLYTLPIHVCSLMFSLVLLHAWTNAARPGTLAAGLHRFLGAVIFHPGILGALSALLFPDWLYYPAWNYVSVSSFLGHGLILVYGASLLVNLTEAPDGPGRFWGDLKCSALFLLVGAAGMYFFDRATGTNYWFMAGPGNDSPFIGAWAGGGYAGYLAAFALTVLIVTALWYGLRRLLFVRGRKP